MATFKPTARLASLDILRGFDLFLLVFFQPVLLQFGHQLDNPTLNTVLCQFDHEIWEGFRFWDLVMPLFMFMAGASMPFSFSKYKNQPNKKNAYRKIFRRVALLFLLGMIVQGNLLDFSPETIHFYNNTLQAIATGYFISAVILLNCSVRKQVMWTVFLLIIYGVPMAFWGDFTQEGNFANWVEQIVVGHFRDDPTYTWIWSSLTFGATVMLGVFAGHIMKNGADCRGKVVQRLLIIGFALIAAALLWSLQMPIIKRIWTSSMTLLSGGYCFLLMALFYYWIDYKGNVKGFNWLKIYGMNSIAAYMLGETVNFRSVVESLLHGTQQFAGAYYPAILASANYLIVFLILRFMYKYKIFLKV